MPRANTLALFRLWLAQLPEALNGADIQSCLYGGGPSDMKRVVAYRWLDGSGCGIVVNPMGTHLDTEGFWNRVEVISTFDRRFVAPVLGPDPMIEALELAAQTFEWYGRLHYSKGTQDGNEKAEANLALAAQMRAAISKAKGETP